MSGPAQNFVRFLGATGLIVAVAAALNFVVDPLQLFRPAHLFAAMYSQDSRLQDAGLVRSQDFDTVFMGTSLAIHFRQSDIDRMLGGKSLKLALNGSNSREQVFVLAAALDRHPGRVIWEVDDWIFHDAPDIDSTHIVSPPQSSVSKPLSANSCLTLSILAPGLSILLIATTIGTPAALQ